MDNLNELKQLAERLEKANAESKEILERAEKLKEQDILGGKANAGTEAPQLSEEDKIRNGTKDFFKGTDIERAFHGH